MRKKTISGVTALTMLASATIPVYAAPIEKEEYGSIVASNKSTQLTSNLSMTKGMDDIKRDEEGWIQTTTIAQLDQLWNYRIDEVNKTIILESFKYIDSQLDEMKVEIPRQVAGYKIALENLNNNVFPGVTQIRVAPGDEEFVKVLATDLSNGFKNNDKLKYVDFEGLNVSGVKNMSELFSMCSNLRVIKIIDWVIQDSTSIMGMFYAKRLATNEEKKLLVITNDVKIKRYGFASSNRIPYMVTFSGNGGHFLGDKDIWNYIIPRFTINTDVFEEVEQIVEYDRLNVIKPSRDGYEFKEWVIEGPTPTNILELLDLTFKAKWEKVTEEENPEPEQPEPENPKPENPEQGQPEPENPKPENPEQGQPESENPKPENPEQGQPEPENPNPEQPEQENPNPDNPEQPPVEDVPTNGIENLTDLNKELQEKVDSLISEVVVSESGLSLDITGDNEDIVHVNEIEVTKEGIFATVDGERLKFGVALDGVTLDLKNTRAIRITEANKYAAIPHQSTNEGLKIVSNNFENIFITSKVEEPFLDVEDKHWFKGDVEEAFNYGFTLGTSATTFSPYVEITRAEFAVMIARALELKSENVTDELKDIKGKWYASEVQALYEAGIVTGFGDQTFGGEKKVTREQASAMLGRMLEHVGVDTKVTDDIQFADMNQIGNYAKQSIQYLASNGVLVNGANTKFNPHNNLTRAEMAKMLVRSLHLSDLY